MTKRSETVRSEVTMLARKTLGTLLAVLFAMSPFALGEGPSPALHSQIPEPEARLLSFAPSPYTFLALPNPCRQYDSRNATPLPDNTPRTIALSGAPCGIPPFSASAVSVNITIFNITGATGNGVLKVGPSLPLTTAWINFPPSETQRANAGVAPVDSNGFLIVEVNQGGGQIDFTVDVNGWSGSQGPSVVNVALGYLAGNLTMTGSPNVAIGSQSLQSNAAGMDNTAVGETALQLNSSGSRNVGVGSGAGSALTTGNDNIDISNGGKAGESNTIRIGFQGTQTAAYIAGISNTAVTGVPVLVNTTSGQLGVASSSLCVKEEIRDVAEESDGLMKLRPVAFRYKPEIDPTGLAQYGLIAEEVADVYPDLVVSDKDGNPETVRYHLVNALLLNEVQKQHRTIEAQTQEIASLRKVRDEQFAALQARLAALEEQVREANSSERK